MRNACLVPNGGTVTPPVPVLRPSGFDWVAKRGILSLLVIGLFTCLGIGACRSTGLVRLVGLLALAIAIGMSVSTASAAWSQIGSPVPLQLSLPILSPGEIVELDVKNTPLWRVDLSWFGWIAVLEWHRCNRLVIHQG